MRIIISWVLLAALLPSCRPGGAGTAAGPAAPSPGTAVAPDTGEPLMPRSVGAFVERNRERYPNPALGLRVRYASASGIGADAYLYPNALAAGDTSLESLRHAAGEEAGEAAEAIRIFEQRGAYTDVTFKEPARLQIRGPSGRELPGTHIAATLRQGGQLLRSDIYVFVLGPRYLKIRATYPAGEGASASSDEVRTLAAGLVAALDARPSSAARSP